MNLAYITDPIDRLHQENQRFLKQRQFQDRNNMPFAYQVERDVAAQVEALGYQVVETANNDPYDLEVIDRAGRYVRIEVKGSQLYFQAHSRTMRYQANVRNRNCDLLIFACFDGSRYHHFIIPKKQLGSRHSLTISSPDPAAYKGQWADYYEAWSNLERAFERARPYPKQLIFNL